MSATTTSDGNGGTLIAIAVRTTGDGFLAVIFFDNTNAIGQVDSNYGAFGPILGPPRGVKYTGVNVAGPQAFSIDWNTWSQSNFSGLCCPNGPSVPWIYHWNGSRLQASGEQPPTGYQFFS